MLFVTNIALMSKQTCFEIASLYGIASCFGQLAIGLASPFHQVKTEVVKEVAAARRKQHLSSLQYYCALNALQCRKRVAMMEPMLGFARGQVGQSPCPEGSDLTSCGEQHGVLLTWPLGDMEASSEKETQGHSPPGSY